MPFIPHTQKDINDMLASIKANSIDELFDEIPDALRNEDLDDIPQGMNELEVTRLMHARANRDGMPICFIGAGAYDHHVPAAVWEITTRGEFYSAYTPYQAEASQGTLQLLYEYQTMITRLMAMDVANASLYDGASGLAEAVLMAVRANRKSKSRRILMPRTVNPVYRKVTDTIVRNQKIILHELDYNQQGGHIDPASLPADPGDVTALVIPQPNFFGTLEDVDALTDWAHKHNILVIAVVNPIATALLTPPGEWGSDGADIVCGEGQPLGAPVSSGGPYFGFMCCKKALIRQMPGRIIGRTVDTDGKPGFSLTLQAREQHIRRSKATSNICTNQGLLVTAATIYMSILGAQGLENTARQSHINTLKLTDSLTSIPGVELVFNRPYFHEAVIRVNAPATELIKQLANENIAGGYNMSRYYPELENTLLVCATEMRTQDDIEKYRAALEKILS